MYNILKINEENDEQKFKTIDTASNYEIYNLIISLLLANKKSISSILLYKPKTQIERDGIAAIELQYKINNNFIFLSEESFLIRDKDEKSLYTIKLGKYNNFIITVQSNFQYYSELAVSEDETIQNEQKNEDLVFFFDFRDKGNKFVNEITMNKKYCELQQRIFLIDKLIQPIISYLIEGAIKTNIQPITFQELIKIDYISNKNIKTILIDLIKNRDIKTNIERLFFNQSLHNVLNGKANLKDIEFVLKNINIYSCVIIRTVIEKIIDIIYKNSEINNTNKINILLQIIKKYNKIYSSYEISKIICENKKFNLAIARLILSDEFIGVLLAENNYAINDIFFALSAKTELTLEMAELILSNTGIGRLNNKTIVGIILCNLCMNENINIKITKLILDEEGIGRILDNKYILTEILSTLLENPNISQEIISTVLNNKCMEQLKNQDGRIYFVENLLSDITVSKTTKTLINSEYKILLQEVKNQKIKTCAKKINYFECCEKTTVKISKDLLSIEELTQSQTSLQEENTQNHNGNEKIVVYKHAQEKNTKNSTIETKQNTNYGHYD